MGAETGNPTDAVVSDGVRKLVVEAYCELEHADRAVVDAGFAGGLPFDSIIGVEIAAQLEIKLGIRIPEEMLMKSSIYKSLSSFAAVVQLCINTSNDK